MLLSGSIVGATPTLGPLQSSHRWRWQGQRSLRSYLQCPRLNPFRENVFSILGDAAIGQIIPEIPHVSGMDIHAFDQATVGGQNAVDAEHPNQHRNLGDTMLWSSSFAESIHASSSSSARITAISLATSRLPKRGIVCSKQSGSWLRSVTVHSSLHVANTLNRRVLYNSCIGTLSGPGFTHPLSYRRPT